MPSLDLPSFVETRRLLATLCPATMMSTTATHSSNCPIPAVPYPLASRIWHPLEPETHDVTRSCRAVRAPVVVIGGFNCLCIALSCVLCPTRTPVRPPHSPRILILDLTLCTDERGSGLTSAREVSTNSSIARDWRIPSTARHRICARPMVSHRRYTLMLVMSAASKAHHQLRTRVFL